MGFDERVGSAAVATGDRDRERDGRPALDGRVEVVLVDWLGRGGIAQCTDAWRHELAAAGRSQLTVTVADRELHGPDVVATPLYGNRVRRHRDLARCAAASIVRRRPDTVVVQNHVLAPLEGAVVDAARSVGAQVVWVVHDHRLHSPLAGTTIGARRNLDRADVVVTHSRYVADRLRTRTEIRVLPHPIPPAFRNPPTGAALFPRRPGRLLGLHFGVLKRRYKGAALFARLADAAPEPWDLAAVGVGAPQAASRLSSIARFVSADDLAATVATADAAILPYRHATQSGAVAVAQALGTVPVSSAVGGLMEQIDHGRTGLLVEAGAGPVEWAEVQDRLRDDHERGRLAEAAAAAARAADREFAAGIRELLG